MYLWQECNTFESLSLEYGHDGLDDSMMVATKCLVFQYYQKCSDDHGLEIIIGRGGSSDLCDWACICFNQRIFGFLFRFSLHDGVRCYNEQENKTITLRR